jgi:hypothetical protein
MIPVAQASRELDITEYLILKAALTNVVRRSQPWPGGVIVDRDDVARLVAARKKAGPAMPLAALCPEACCPPAEPLEEPAGTTIVAR